MPEPGNTRWYLDPVAITLMTGLGCGLYSFSGHSIGLGWLIGLMIGTAAAIIETNRTPKDQRRRKFTSYMGSGRYGTPFVHDSRLISVFCFGLAGLVAEWIGMLLAYLAKIVLR